jgi:flagella basal body P-ring formation protein FlgA
MRARAFLFYVMFFIVPIISVGAKPSSGIRQRLEALAVKKVKTECRSCKVTVKCKWISPIVLKKTPNAVKDLIFDKPGIPAGYVTAKVLFKDNTPLNNKIQLYVSVRRKLPVARTLIKRGETIHEDDLVWQWKDVSQLINNPISSVEGFRGKTTTRIVREGQVFYQADLAGAAVIQAGDHVTMLYDKGGVRIDFDCIARETKRAWQAVRLYSKETGRLYIAKIIKKDKIILERTL